MTDMPQGRRTVSDEEIIEYMEQSDDPAFVAVEIAEKFGINKETARQRLNDLAERGEIHRKKPSARTVVWWSDVDHNYSARSA